jgi:hypothetical protein
MTQNMDAGRLTFRPALFLPLPFFTPIRLGAILN